MKKIVKRLFLFNLLLVLAAFGVLNVVAYRHAYNFTHFTPLEEFDFPEDPEDLNNIEKWKLIWEGIPTPRPENHIEPAVAFETLHFESESGSTLEAWLIRSSPEAKGTAIIFHGYTNTKSQFFTEANMLRGLGYHTLLVDFRAHGGSTGQRCTIGHDEALDVKAAFEYASEHLEGEVVLLGVSMGAVAVLRAVSEWQLPAGALLLECPYGSMLQAVRNRFEMLNLPSWGLAEILVFWGGWQNNYWAFGLNSVAYAQNVKVPTLLMYGNQDLRVSLDETSAVFAALAGRKSLKIFENIGHSSYASKYPQDWALTVQNFLEGR